MAVKHDNIKFMPKAINDDKYKKQIDQSLAVIVNSMIRYNRVNMLNYFYSSMNCILRGGNVDIIYFLYEIFELIITLLYVD